MSIQTKLINQGGFGCVFYPAIECNGTINKSTKYASKLLKKDNNELIKIDEDAFMKIYVYLTHKIHSSIINYNPSIENPYSLLYKLNKL